MTAALKRPALLMRSLPDAVCGRLACPGLVYDPINRSPWKHCHLLPDFGALFLCLATKKQFGVVRLVPAFAHKVHPAAA